MAALIAGCLLLLLPVSSFASPDTGNSAHPISFETLSHDPTIASHTTGILEANGNYFASYTDESKHMLVIQSSDRGENWILLYRSPEGEAQPAALATDAAGRVYAVYNTGSGESRFLRFDPMSEDKVLFRASFETESDLAQWQIHNPLGSHGRFRATFRLMAVFIQQN
jgi:hypothetical protein